MVKFNEIDRFSETHDAKLANIAVILYQRLACKNDESIDYILDRLRDIEDFDSSYRQDLKEHTKSFHSLYTYLWRLENGRKRRNHGTT